MTEPHNTEPPYENPYPGSSPSDRRRVASMWGWIVGIAVVILVAFIVAAVWSGDTRTAGTAPIETTGLGTTATHPTPPPATTGQSPTMPAIAPNNKMTPQTTPATK